MKFRYYVADTNNGEIVGTDDKAVATNYAEAEENFVIDAETGKAILWDGREENIQKAAELECEEEDDSAFDDSDDE